MSKKERFVNVNVNEEGRKQKEDVREKDCLRSEGWLSFVCVCEFFFDTLVEILMEGEERP